jgi:hypothetical protein
VNKLLDLIKGTNLFTQELTNMEKYNKPMAAVLGMKKTDFHVIKLVYNLRAQYISLNTARQPKETARFVYTDYTTRFKNVQINDFSL